MKNIVRGVMMTLIALTFFISCSDDDSNGISSITLSASSMTVERNTAVSFTVTSNTDANVTDDAVFLINGNPINSNEYTPLEVASFKVIARYSSSGNLIESNELTINVTQIPLTNLVLTANTDAIGINEEFVFTTTGNNGVDYTSDSSFTLDGVAINDNRFTPTQTGTYDIQASYDNNGTQVETAVLTVEALPERTTVTVYDNIIFYDGYAAVVNEPVPPNTIRKSNSAYVKKLNAADLSKISDDVTLDITLHARCDNYDRIAGVFLNLLPSGTPYSNNAVVERIELGRFITPFMNKNIMPDEVPFRFEVDNFGSIVNDPVLNATYDFYMEMFVFGVPYAAQNEVQGCAGRNDTFGGTLKILSRDNTYTPNAQSLVNIASYFSLRSYNANGTDVPGETVKTFNFNVPTALTNAKIYVISSNHGANQGGEEYNRRDHFLYLDGAQIAMYKPGGKSCEPYRQYNTQGNGIYGSSPRSAAEWESFSNWCPGDVIPIRIYDIGAITSGQHSLRIEVPDAEFRDDEGYIPFSAYLQGE